MSQPNTEQNSCVASYESVDHHHEHGKEGLKAPTPADLTVSSEWFEFILQKKGLLNHNDENHVLNVEMKPLAENRGLCAVMTRLSVTYSDPDCKLPKSFVLKSIPNTEEARAQSSTRGQFREGLFYESDLLEKLDASENHVLYAHGCEKTGEYIILMNDLKNR